MFATIPPRQTYDRYCPAGFSYNSLDSKAVAVHRLGLERVLEVHPIPTWTESGRTWTASDDAMVITALNWHVTNFDTRWALHIAKNALGENALGERGESRVHRFRNGLRPPESHEQTVITNYRQAMKAAGMDPADVPHAMPAKLMPHPCSGDGCQACDGLFG
jgi:hypothetical protein